jgi:hypothetical protein
MRKDTKVERYEYTNEVINGLLEEGESLWICQGTGGRLPILAKTKKEALEAYIAKVYTGDYEEDVEKHE